MSQQKVICKNCMKPCSNCGRYGNIECIVCKCYKSEVIKIDVGNNLQDPLLLSRIIWQYLFNLYRENGGDLSKIDSLLCDLYTLEQQLKSCPIHLQWSFDPCGPTWITTEYYPESDFEYWIDWSGKRDEPIVIKRIPNNS